MALRLIQFVLAALVVGACVSGSSRVTAEDRERLKPYILDQAPAAIQHDLGIDYDHKITLVGYDLEPAEGVVRPGQRIKLTLYWQCQKQLDEGWNLFTHVLDGAGVRILNADNVGPLREWRDDRQVLAPSTWEAGKVYVDEQDFQIPEKLETRTVQVVTGIWKRNDRLPIVAGPKDRENRGIVVDLAVTSGKPTRRSKSTRVPKLRVDRLDQGARVVIDGVLDEPAWTDAAKTGPFVDVATGEPNRSSDLGGWVKLLWDPEALYVGFDVRDTKVVGGFDPKSIDPHLWTKDTVEIMVDPDGDGDNRDYYEIQIGPQNLVFDSRFDNYNQPKVEPDGPFGHQAWSANLQSAVKIRGSIDQDQDRDDGYVVEARIPWASFDRAKSAPPALGDTWRMNFYIMQNNGGVSWSPILQQGNFHKASRFGRVLWAAKGWSAPDAVSAPSATPAPSADTPSKRAAAERVRRPPSSPRPGASAATK